ncbi:MAG: hypothetical protein EHM70_11700 [Chloroflexota bacterium]|nr:MAG: hypothetical protein EHM70_11700 [Chloroflexota bacterium]
MTEQNQAKAITTTDADFQMRRFREYVTATIAFVVVIVYPLGVTLLELTLVTTPEAHERLKDMLLFINPILGFVLGFYFNKSSSETRAESAESTARNASVTAVQASQARDEALDAEKEAMEKVDEARGLIDEMGEAAMKLETAEATSRTLSDDETAPAAASSAAARQDLLRAWERAKKVLA